MLILCVIQVFQRRQSGAVDFDREWIDYQNGFGDLSKNFWLGSTVRAVIYHLSYLFCLRV